MDPVTAFGLVSGVLQIGDTALRSSRNIHKFLQGIKSSTRDIDRLRRRKFLHSRWYGRESLARQLRVGPQKICRIDLEMHPGQGNVEHLMEDLIRYVEDFQSANERTDRELPRIVFDAINGFQADINNIQLLLPSELALSNLQKARWVLAKKKRDEILSILEEREQILHLALTLVGRYIFIGILPA